MYSWQSLDPLPLLGEQAGDRWPIEIYGRAASIRRLLPKDNGSGQGIWLGIVCVSGSATDSD